MEFFETDKEIQVLDDPDLVEAQVEDPEADELGHWFEVSELVVVWVEWQLPR
jgi:hypothetical protein